MDEPQKKYKWAKLLVKVIVSVTALYIVFTKIDISETLQTLKSINFLWIMVGVLILVIAQLISTFRLNKFYHVIGIPISQSENVRLYLLGMFYNLFLPGSIGGDAYKVYVLRKRYDSSLKRTIAATIMDRVSGLTALTMLGLVLLLVSSFGPFLADNSYHYLILILILISYPFLYLAQRILFLYLIPAFTYTSLLSIIIQMLQVLLAYTVLTSLSVESHIVDYLVIFMASSIVAVIPFTIGGIGARELVFVFAQQYFHIDIEIAIAFSLLYFILNVVVSFFGIFVRDDFETRVVQT